jgi:hypothetical protein
MSTSRPRTEETLKVVCVSLSANSAPTGKDPDLLRTFQSSSRLPKPTHLSKTHNESHPLTWLGNACL